jgi:hypothetical protein
MLLKPLLDNLGLHCKFFFISCKVMGLTSGDHTPEDAILEGVQYEINNIVPGTGFDIIRDMPPKEHTENMR